MSGGARRRVVFGTEVDSGWAPRVVGGPTELVLSEAMPGVCSEHGVVAATTRVCTVNSSGPLSEMPTVRAMVRSMRPGRRGAVEARVRFECPACELCLEDVRRFRWVAVVAALLVPLTLAGVVAARALEFEAAYVPLAVAVVPGCFPLALLAALLAWSRSGYFADVWMDPADHRLIVSAHPDFVAVVERQRAQDHR